MTSGAPIQLEPGCVQPRDHGLVVGKRSRAEVTPAEIEAVILVRSTPFYTQLSMDGFELLKRLRLPDHLPPIQLQAGCAAMARAVHLLGQMQAERALIIAYEVSSPYMTSPIYYQNSEHPLKDHLWMSAALFGDGAGALVLRWQREPTGFSFYSRDSLRFGDRPGFEDPLIHYPGGSALHPPCRSGAEELAAFGMNGPATKQYYLRGMVLNHATFTSRSWARARSEAAFDCRSPGTEPPISTRGERGSHQHDLIGIPGRDVPVHHRRAV
jgi:3-oxoacyl-[acyl-carrier-protein] synthase-3